MARKSRGIFGSAWWSQHWVECLESFGWSVPLSRGKAYARKGAVTELKIMPGMAEACVAGGRTRQYRVSIHFDRIPEEKWDEILDLLAGKALFTARLLNGEIPEWTEELMQQARLSLFPASLEALRFHCTCGEEEEPCRHVGALCYQLAVEFAQDPGLLFLMRGMEKEEILRRLRERRTVRASKPEETERQDGAFDDEERYPSLGESIERFWTGKMKKIHVKITIEPPPVEQAILKRLGEPFFLEGKKDMIRQIEADYQRILQKAMNVGYNE